MRPLVMLTSKSDTIIAHIFQRKFPLSGDLFLKSLKLFSPTLARCERFSVF